VLTLVSSDGEAPPDSALIRIIDLDAPVYRIVPLWFLDEALRLRVLTLNSPTRWEDPYELIGEKISIVRKVGEKFEQTMPRPLPAAFAQCWSATKESDTLLRAYSRVVRDPYFARNLYPREEGVRVRSTPRKLLEALRRGTQGFPDNSCYIGAVQYMSEAQLQQELANAVAAHGMDVFSTPSNLAKLLLMKRDAFQHEAEVRLLYVEQREVKPETVFRVQFDPNEVFEDITFDPRLAEFERKEREAIVRGAGYSGSVSHSQLYQNTMLEVLIDLPPPS
jgi:hypothetical protein